MENKSTLISNNFVALQNLKRNISVSFSSNQVSKNYSLIDQKNNKKGVTDKLFTLFLHYLVPHLDKLQVIKQNLN